jgi:hypothetical protein
MHLRCPSALLALGALAFASAPAQTSFSDLTKSPAQLAGQPAAAEVKLPADLVSGLKGLAASFNLSQLNYVGLAKDALGALNAGQDSKALAALDKIGAAKLTPAQLTAFNTAKTAVDAYVVQRNFSGVPAVKTLVADSVAQIKGGDFAGVAGKLQNFATTLKPTTEQKAVLDSLIAHYKGWAAKK